MKRVLLAALAAGISTSAAADLVAKNGDNELRLLNTPCVNSAVLAHIRDEWRDKFKTAQAQLGPQFFHACWIDTEQGAYFVIYSDGDQSAIPVRAFIDQPGI
jgi:hypothetical protein